jgi:threonine synthase
MFASTRGESAPVSLSEALRRGAAPDGGLYLPERVPEADLAGLNGGMPLAELATALLAAFFEGDALEGELAAICREAFTFPAPLVPQQDGLHALELFHGPTGAFKDFGARFLMACFDRLGDPERPLAVLAATSGDTGGAVGCAAEGRGAVRAVILYPKGRISKFQQLQLTCWREPVRALEVEGDFDDCQRLVKAAFADAELTKAHNLTSANSINIGRLLPQMVYVASAAMKLFEATGERPGFLIPAGNLGHGFAALYARAMGLPIGPVVLATNANRTLNEWHRTGDYEPRASVATIANAMDVGTPSNFERLMELTPDQRDVRVELVEDEDIRARIRADFQATGYIWCPHTATAAEAWHRLPVTERRERPWIAAATAHPYKFADVIEPVIGRPIDAPPALGAILDRPVRKSEIEVDLAHLVRALGSGAG